MPTDGVWTGRCDQPLMPWSHQTARPVRAMKSLGIMLGNLHCYKLRCWRMVSELAGVISPSCLDHTKLPVRFEPCNRWGLCWEICTVTNGDADGWCLNWPVWLAHRALITPNCPSGSSHVIVGDYVEKSTMLQTETVTDGANSGWCDQPLTL